MSAQINDGGPAFPRAGFLSEIETPERVIAQYENKPEQGMTLRDYFAGQALAGILTRKESDGWTNREVASDCYSYADAMLAAREAKS